MASLISNLNDFKNICRICLEQKPHMISIFKKVLSPCLQDELTVVYNSKSYMELIGECTSIHISENDILPKNLCKLCSKQLEQCHKLKIKCLSSEKTLQNFKISFENSTESQLFTENNDSSLKETKNNVCDNVNEILVKTEIVEDIIDVNESKLNINYTEQVENLYKTDDDNYDKDDENVLNTSFNNEISTKEEPEEDSQIYKNEFDVHEDNKKYNCKNCADQFDSKVELTNHKKLHLKPRIKCEFCSKVFLINSAFQNHFYRPKHRCKICLKEFDCNGNFISHLKERITCEKCGETYNHNRHDIHRCLKLQEKPCLLCPCCGKIFTEKWNFEQHMMRHKNERSHQCKICDSKFNTSNLLKVHLIAHTNEKPHVCEVCKKSYKYASSLRRHKVSHTNYRIPCNFCDKLWKSKDTLRKHQLVHTGERKFVCTYCSKPFGRHDNLQMHLRIHTGEKPFVCDKCGTGFSAKHVLRGHMKTHER